ncbi:MAG: hypothetical protein M0010_20750 [Actinomycetota bacterium]|nr:hypothetical protein [Actinomycetota bacterium]
MDEFIARCATAPGAAEDMAAWLRADLADVGARRLRHPGNHRYLFCLGRNCS